MKGAMWCVAGVALLAGGLGLRAAERAGAEAALSPRSGIDKAHFDATVRPQDDLYRYVNGRWLAEAAIPSDRPLDGAFYQLRDKSESDLRTIIEKAAAKSEGPAGSEARKIGDLY